MDKHCDQCQQLDALNTDLTKLLKALIKGEADDKHPLMKVWFLEREKMQFCKFLFELDKHLLTSDFDQTKEFDEVFIFIKSFAKNLNLEIET